MTRTLCVNCGAVMKKMSIGHSLCNKCWLARLQKISERLNNGNGKGNTDE